MRTHTNKNNLQSPLSARNNIGGFTIIELLVVIVIIAILAALAIFSYLGLIKRAETATIQSDLSNNSRRLKSYHAIYGSYPTALNASYCPAAPSNDTTLCLKFSPGTSFGSYTGNISTFNLQASRGGLPTPFQITETGGATAIAAATGPPSHAVTSIAFGTPQGDTLTVPQNTGAPITKVRIDQTVSYCHNIIESQSVSYINATTIAVTQWNTIQRWTDTCPSGYLGEVPTDIWVSNSYGTGPVYSYVDFWE